MLVAHVWPNFLAVNSCLRKDSFPLTRETIVEITALPLLLVATEEFSAVFESCGGEMVWRNELSIRMI